MPVEQTLVLERQEHRRGEPERDHGEPTAAVRSERGAPDDHHDAGCDRAERRIPPEREVIGEGRHAPDDDRGEHHDARARGQRHRVRAHDLPARAHPVDHRAGLGTSGCRHEDPDDEQGRRCREPGPRSAPQRADDRAGDVRRERRCDQRNDPAITAEHPPEGERDGDAQRTERSDDGEVAGFHR